MAKVFTKSKSPEHRFVALDPPRIILELLHPAAEPALNNQHFLGLPSHLETPANGKV
ncbi:hypothetical protein PtA15_7A175 [Puccinia triticina]|uniref:Uncharacterized protein n=1 Tax=Puccinia triticina TaxID=208348 RepID=A0ABY7CMQ3_9BASI|nr:uncharacterized protein PtA15_7A175 [Puccinia triticina]WAQ86449.1 hypothetical protein PtA15_7A175 [Puccinia triticina]WAR56329.1 hypothetical protein PtB15_7B175 [Puccinia triticina]